MHPIPALGGQLLHRALIPSNHQLASATQSSWSSGRGASPGSGKLLSHLEPLLARCNNLGKVLALVDLFIWNPISTWIGVRTLEQREDISADQRQALVVKRFVDILWDVFYWGVFVLSQDLAKRRIARTPLSEGARAGAANLIAIFSSALINEILKPILSNTLTCLALNQHDRNNPLGWYYRLCAFLFGYREETDNRNDFIDVTIKN